MSIVLQAFRANQTTPIDLSQTISTCEQLCFRTVLGKPPLNSVCAFQAGTLSITTPDGQTHNVTPAGGIPCLGGTNPTFCNPSTMSITSNFVCYTVRSQDISGGGLLARTAYANGTSHSAPSDLLGVVRGGTALALDVEDCATASDCSPTICDPQLSDGVRTGMCTTSDLPLSTPCEADEDPCTIDHCDGNGECVQQTVIQCNGPTGPCDGGQRCDSTTGQCVNEPDAAVSTPCEADDNLCTVDHCNGSGSCVQQSTVTCPGSTGFCDGGQRCEPSTGQCVNEPDTPASTPCNADDDLCTVDHCNGSGSCVQQSTVTCPEADGPCDGGQRCEPETGTCVEQPDTPASTPCNVDGDLCTVDHCDGNGQCVQQSEVTCPGPTPPCDGGQRCEPSTGQCVDEPDTPESTPCEADEDLCTVDHCDGNGQCVQQSTVPCTPAAPPCEGGAICNPESGECEDQPDGQISTPCDADGDMCTLDHCNGAGACVFQQDNPALECNRDHYKCYRTRPPRTPPRTVNLVDQFRQSQPTLLKTIRFCNPVDKNDEGIHDTTAHLACYKIRETGFQRQMVRVTNQFGVQTLIVTRPETLCVPAEKDNVPSPLNVNHFKCYRVIQTKGPEFEEQDVSLDDQFETKETEVMRPLLLCNPVNKNNEGVLDPSGHLTCYKIQDAPGQPDFVPRPVEFEDQFSSDEVPTTRRTDCSSSRLLCVPSTKEELGQPRRR